MGFFLFAFCFLGWGGGRLDLEREADFSLVFWGGGGGDGVVVKPALVTVA